jgi:DNA-binding LytR/AlgR family response regulator
MMRLLLIKDPSLLPFLLQLQAQHGNGLQFLTEEQWLQLLEPASKKRMIVRKGLEHVALKLEEIVMFYTENKVVYTIDATGRKYLAEKNLGDLEKELDAHHFFRANRQYLVNLDYIHGYRPYEKVKLEIELRPQFPPHQVIVSQETAPVFREWMMRA